MTPPFANDILFLMPKWRVYSEVWLQRMLEMLESRLIAIAAEDAAKTWGDSNIPGIRLSPQQTIATRVLGKIFGRQWPSFYEKYIVGKKMSRLMAGKKAGERQYIFCHYLNFAMHWYNRLLLHNARWLIHCHGHDIAWDGFSEQHPYKPLHPPDYPDHVKKIAQTAHFIANSKYTKGKLEEMGVPEDRIFLKYFGVETEWVERDFTTERELNILYLGRLVDCKGPDLVIKAFLIALKEGFKGNLTIAGDGSMRNICELLARRSQYSDKINFLGAVDRDQGNKLFHSADIFTHHNCLGPLSNREEAFGVSLIEAMGRGLPVVTGKSGGVKESVIDGETGLLVSPGDVEAHAQAILDLQNPALRARMSKAAYEHVCSNFSIAKETTQLQNIFNSLSHNLEGH